MITQAADSERIATIAELVLPGLPAADVGTDHVRLPLRLIRSGRCPHVVALDRSPEVVRRARRRVAEAGEDERIDVREGNGLLGLAAPAPATVVIAGMGGQLIRSILDEGRAALAGTRRLVLGPHRDVECLRAWLASNAWRVVDERLVHERHGYYWLLAAEPAASPLDVSPLDLALGSIVRHRDDPTFDAYAARERARLTACLEALAERPGARSASRRRELERRMAWIDEAGKERACTAHS